MVGDLITVLLQISSRLQYWKNFENRSVLDEVMPKILLVPFFPDMVYKLISLMNVIKYFGGGGNFEEQNRRDQGRKWIYSDAECEWQCDPRVSRSKMCSPRPVPTRFRLVTYSLSCLIAFTCSSTNSDSNQFVIWAHIIQNKLHYSKVTRTLQRLLDCKTDKLSRLSLCCCKQNSTFNL